MEALGGGKGRGGPPLRVTHGLLKWQLSQRYPVPELAGRGKPFRALYGCTPYLSHDLAVRLVDLTVGLGGILNTGPPLRTRLDSRPAPLTASPGRYPGQGPSPLNKYQAWLPLLQPVNQPNHCVIRPSHAGLESAIGWFLYLFSKQTVQSQCHSWMTSVLSCSARLGKSWALTQNII